MISLRNELVSSEHRAVFDPSLVEKVSEVPRLVRARCERTSATLRRQVMVSIWGLPDYGGVVLS